MITLFLFLGLIFILLFLMGFILAKKYVLANENKLNFKTITQGSFFFEVFLLIITVYLISLPIQLILLLGKYQISSASNMTYYDILDVGNGIVAVGSRFVTIDRKTASRAAIRKLSYQGKVLWDQHYYDPSRGYLDEFDHVYLSAEGNYVVHGIKSLIQYSPKGEIISVGANEYNVMEAIDKKTNLSIKYQYDRGSEDIGLVVTDNKEQILNQFTYQYSGIAYSQKNVSLVGVTDSNIFVGINTYKYDDETEEARLLVFKRDFTFVSENIFHHQNRYIKHVTQGHGGGIYVLWNDRHNYKSSISRLEITDWQHFNFGVVDNVEIEADTTFTQLEKIYYDGKKMILLGNKYYKNEFRPTGTGIIVDYDLYGKPKIRSLTRGYDLSVSYLKDDQIFAVVRYNPKWGYFVSSYSNHNLRNQVSLINMDLEKIKYIG